VHCKATFIKRFLSLCLLDFSARLSYNIARTPILPLFAAALGAGPEAIGLVVGASTITGIFFKAPTGAISDVVGRSRTLLLGALIFAFTPFVYVFISSISMLVIVRLFHGLATSIYGPVASALVASMAGRQRGEYMAWFSVIKIATNALGGFAGGGLLYLIAKNAPHLRDFHIAYIICGLTGFVSLLLAFPLLRKIEVNPSGNGQGKMKRGFGSVANTVREMAGNRLITLTSGMEGVQNMAMGVLQAFLPLYAVKEASLNVFEAGLLWSGLTGVSVISKPVMGRISDLYGRKWVIVSGMFLCAIPLSSLTLSKSFFPLLLLCILFGLGEAFVTSATGAFVADISKKESLGAAMGLFGTIADTGQALGPVVAGLLLGLLGYFGSFTVIAMMLMVFTVVFSTVVRK
jgi:DHA1 family multidrug resistance protein-like MFS transporter